MSSTGTEDLVVRLRAAGCVFAEDEAALLIAAAVDDEQLRALVERRIAGFPLEHLLGWAEFRGLRVAVTPDVFVPRQRTGFLVEQAIALGRAMIRIERGSDDSPSGTPSHHAPMTVLDMCCGSGALGMAFAIEAAAEGIRVDLTATDIEPAAVACARTNLAPLGARVTEGDLFTPVPAELRGRVDILLANTPYVPSDAIASMPPEARDHEPRVALDGGADGLDVLRRIATVATEWLAPGGHLLVEESEEQAPRAVQVLREHGLTARIAEDEDLGATVVIGTRPTDSVGHAPAADIGHAPDPSIPDAAAPSVASAPSVNSVPISSAATAPRTSAHTEPVSSMASAPVSGVGA